MRRDSLPVIGARYWVAISAASVFGANLGDFVSHDLGLGHWRGLPVLAAAFAAALLAERRGRASEAWYWLAIVLLRTAATNLGDLATHDGHVDPVLAMAGLTAALAAFVAAGRRLAVTAGDGAVRPAADAWYWAAMLTAGTLGTVAGDYVEGDLGLGSGWATVVLLAVQCAVLGAGARSGWRGKVAYWGGIAAIRTMGTTLGDYLAFRHGLALGLPASTALSGIVMAGVLLAWGGATPRPAPVRP